MYLNIIEISRNEEELEIQFGGRVALVCVMLCWIPSTTMKNNKEMNNLEMIFIACTSHKL